MTTVHTASALLGIVSSRHDLKYTGRGAQAAGKYYTTFYKGLEHLQIWVPARDPGTKLLQNPRDDSIHSMHQHFSLF